MAGAAVLMEGRTPGAFLRGVAPSEGKSQSSGKIAFLEPGGRERNLPANVPAGERKIKLLRLAKPVSSRTGRWLGEGRGVSDWCFPS